MCKTDLNNKAKNEKNKHGYFQNHVCGLPLKKVCPRESIKCSKLKKCVLDWVVVNTRDVRALRMYRSHSALNAEIFRQYEHHPFTLHPFSKVRTCAEIILAGTMLVTNTLTTVYYSSYPLPPNADKFSPSTLTADVAHLALIILNFFTGYIEGDTCPHAVLDLKKILKKYASTWMIIDVATLMGPIGKMAGNQNVDVNLCLATIKIFRLPLLFKFVDNFLNFVSAGFLTKTLTEIFLIIYSCLTWNIYLQFITEYIIEGSCMPENPRSCSWLSVAKLWKAPTEMRLAYAFERSGWLLISIHKATLVGMLRQNANLNIKKHDVCAQAFLLISWFIGKIVVLHCALKYIIVLISSEAARAKYLMMNQQIQAYMNQRKFPPRIKRKILKFYSIKFQSHFFAETRLTSYVSGQLKEDIIMFTCRQLVGDVPFLNQLPRKLLLQIAVRLKVVIFLSGDVIFKINTPGDCLYFIDKGTVAIYSESGKEICHLDDGDFFGEIALLMPHKRRTASVVAVTNCELFGLSKAEFERSIACYPTVYESIKKVATARMYQTYVLNDHHKTEMKMEQDYELKKRKNSL